MVRFKHSCQLKPHHSFVYALYILYDSTRHNDTSQFVQVNWYNRVVSCTLNSYDLISNNFCKLTHFTARVTNVWATLYFV